MKLLTGDFLSMQAHLANPGNQLTPSLVLDQPIPVLQLPEHGVVQVLPVHGGYTGVGVLCHVFGTCGPTRIRDRRGFYPANVMSKGLENTCLRDSRISV